MNRSSRSLRPFSVSGSLAFALGALAPPAPAQPQTPSPLMNVIAQQVDRSTGGVNPSEQRFPQAGGMTWDGLVGITPLVVRDATDPNDVKYSKGFRATVVQYGRFTVANDVVHWYHSNLLDPSVSDPTDYIVTLALQWFRVGGVLTQYVAAADWVADQQDPEAHIVREAFDQATGLDEHRLVSLAPDPNHTYAQTTPLNPYPSSASGVPIDGTYEYMTYRFLMLTGQVAKPLAGEPDFVPALDEDHQLDRSRLGVIPGYVVVKMGAVAGEDQLYPTSVVTAAFTGTLEPLTVDPNDGPLNDPEVRGIEASWTIDRNLVVYFGNADNVNGALDQIMFTVRRPGATEQWSRPRILSSLHSDFGNLEFGQGLLMGYVGTGLEGVRFGDRYRLADRPLAHHDGTPIVAGGRVAGDYPWMLLDGEMVTFQTTNGSDLLDGGSVWNEANRREWFGARRGTQVIVGESTLDGSGRYVERVTDSPSNEFLFRRPTTNSTSTGRFDDAWDPNHFLPVSQRWSGVRVRDRGRLGLYAVPGMDNNYGQKWSEVTFHDGEDGDYLLYSSLHPETRAVAAEPYYKTDFEYAHETSGHHQIVHLVNGAHFPWTYYGLTNSDDLRRDSNVGKVGQGVLFLGSGELSVTEGETGSLSNYANALSVEMFVKAEPGGGLPPIRLAEGPSFRVELQGQTASSTTRAIRAILYTGPNKTAHDTGYVGDATQRLAEGWYHVAVTFEVGVGGADASRTTIYLDGLPIHTSTSTGSAFYFGAQPASPTLEFGPGASGSSLRVTLDEIAISRVARTPDEILRASLRRAAPESGVAYGRGPLPLGITEADLFIPAGKEYDADLIELGRYLFFDQTLSSSGARSCASCHQPALGYSDGRPKALDMNGNALARRTPSIVNLAVTKPGAVYRWDGSATTLEEQMTRPFFGLEMGLADAAELSAKIHQHSSTYAPLFLAAFGTAMETVVPESKVQAALAAFVRNLIAADAPVDRFRSGQAGAFTPSQRRGYALFAGRARCTACHNGASFTDGGFYNTSVDVGAPGADLLRATVTGRDHDRGAAKAPGIRDAGRMQFFDHDGVSLTELMDSYDAGGALGMGGHRKVRVLGLTDAELADLTEFVATGLTSASGGPFDPFAIASPWIQTP